MSNTCPIYRRGRRRTSANENPRRLRQPSHISERERMKANRLMSLSRRKHGFDSRRARQIPPSAAVYDARAARTTPEGCRPRTFAVRDRIAEATTASRPISVIAPSRPFASLPGERHVDQIDRRQTAGAAAAVLVVCRSNTTKRQAEVHPRTAPAAGPHRPVGRRMPLTR